jgi:hypothetical protein
MSQSYIRIRDNVRIKIEVLDDGSVLVSLEQTIGGSSYYDSSWQAVNFRKWPAYRSGYKIRPPGYLARLCGDTLEKRVRSKIAKCQSVAHQIHTAKHTVAKIVPPEEESNLDKLAKRLYRRLLQRLQQTTSYRRQDFSNEELQQLELIFNQAIDNITSQPARREDRLEDGIEGFITTLQMLHPEGGIIQFEPPKSDNEESSTTEEEPQATETSPNRLDDIIIEQDDEENEDD